MALTAEQFLRRQYRQIPRLGKPPQYKRAEPKLPGLPTGRQLGATKEFRKAAVREAAEGRAPTNLLSWGWEYGIKEPLDFLFDTLLAPSYAITSLIRWHSREKDERQTADPHQAFLKGLAAGYKDNKQFQTSMIDVLGEWGLNPETSWGKVGKYALGIGLDIVTDPLVWLTGVGVPRKVLGYGRRAMAYSAKEFAKASKVRPALRIRQGYGSIFTKGQKITEKGLKGYNQILKDLRGAKVLQGVPERQVEQEARQLFLRTIMPTEGKIAEQLTLKSFQATGYPKVSGVKSLLKAWGKKVTRENEEWFLKEGWKKAFMPGGWWVGLPFSPKLMIMKNPRGMVGPHTSSFFGLLFGQMLKHDVPRVAGYPGHPGHALIPKKLHNIWQETVGRPLGALEKKFKQLHVSEAGMTGPMRQMTRQMRDARNRAKHITYDITQAEMVKNPNGFVTKKIGKQFFDVPTKGTALGYNEKRLLGRLLHNASHEGTPTGEVRNWLKKELTNPTAETRIHLSDLKFPAKLSNVHADELSEAGGRLSELFETVYNWDIQRGLDYPSIASYFFLKMGEKTQPVFRGVTGGQPRLSLAPSMDFKRLLQKSWSEIQRAPLKAETGVVAKPIDNIEWALWDRLTQSAKHAIFQDAVDKYGQTIMRHAITASGEAARRFDENLRKIILGDEKFVENYSALALQLADSSSKVRSGLPLVKVRGETKGALRGLFDELVRVDDVQKEVPKLLDDFVEKLPKEIDESNAKKVVNSITEWMKKEGQIRQNQELLTKLREELPRFENDLLNRSVTSAIKNRMKGIRPTTGEYAQLFGRGEKYKEWQTQLKKINPKLQQYLPEIIRAKAGRQKTMVELTDNEIAAIDDLIKPGQRDDRIMRFLSAAENPQNYTGAPDYEKFLPAKAMKTLKVECPFVPGRKVPLKKAATGFNFPQPVIREMNRMFRIPYVMKGTPGGQLLRMWNRATGMLKGMLTGTIIPGVPRPGFFGRNQVDLPVRRLFQALSTGMPLQTPKRTLRAQQIMNGKDMVFDFPGGKMTSSQVMELMDASGYWHYANARYGRQTTGAEQAVSAAISREGETIPGLLALKNRAMNLMPQDLQRNASNLWYKAKPFRNIPMRLGAHQENVALMESALAGLEKGLPASAVKDTVARWLFDYNNLTPWEQTLSQFLLFFNFKRQSMPIIWDTIRENPGIMNVFKRMPDMVTSTKEEEALLPPWVRDYPIVKLAGKPGKLNILSFRNTFTYDMIGELMPKHPGEVVGQLNPLATVPIELAMGEEFYLNGDIPRREYLQRERSDFAFNLPIVKQFLEPRRVTLENGQEYIAVNGKNYHLLSNLWFSRLFRELEMLGQTLEGDKDAMRNVARFGLGLKLYQYDREKQEYWVQTNANKLKSAYTNALQRGDRDYALDLLDRIQSP